MLAVNAKIYGSIIHPALSLLMKHLVIGQRQNAPNFSVFHWPPHGSLVSIGQHFVTTNILIRHNFTLTLSYRLLFATGTSFQRKYVSHLVLAPLSIS